MPTNTLDAVFSALSDPTRRDIVTRLADGPSTVGELARHYPVSAPAISRHLKVLERAGILTRSADAQWRTVTLRPDSLDEVGAWVERHRTYWDGRLDALERHLATDTPDADDPDAPT